MVNFEGQSNLSFYVHNNGEVGVIRNFENIGNICAVHSKRGGNVEVYGCTLIEATGACGRFKGTQDWVFHYQPGETRSLIEEYNLFQNGLELTVALIAGREIRKLSGEFKIGSDEGKLSFRPKNDTQVLVLQKGKKVGDVWSRLAEDGVGSDLPWPHHLNPTIYDSIQFCGLRKQTCHGQESYRGDIQSYAVEASLYELNGKKRMGLPKVNLQFRERDAAKLLQRLVLSGKDAETLLRIGEGKFREKSVITLLEQVVLKLGERDDSLK